MAEHVHIDDGLGEHIGGRDEGFGGLMEDTIDELAELAFYAIVAVKASRWLLACEL